MTFLFVDRILDRTDASHIIGIKHVTASDTYLDHTQEGRLHLCDALVGETLGQLAAWYVMHAKDFRIRPVAGIVDEVRIHDHAYVGDTIELHAHIDHLDDQSVKYHAQAKVNGQVISELIHAVGPFVPMDDFSDRDQVMREFAMIDRPGALPACVTPIEIPVARSPDTPRTRVLRVDVITHYMPHESITASKAISLSAPYFPDHFARNPVFPLSLLLQCYVGLANDFLRLSLGEQAKGFVLTHIQKIKMKQFIRPGDIAMLHVSIAEQSSDQIQLQCQTCIEDKRVFVASMVFSRGNTI